jgi:transposase
MDAFLRQVTETPWYKAFVKEFRLWLKACPKCGKTTRGQMPKGVPDGAFGPQLQARICLLSGRYRLTRRETRLLAKDLFGVRMSLGSVQACCNTVSAAVAGPSQTIHTEVKLAPEVHVDETGFGKCGKDRMWLWVAATEDAEAFRLLPGRGREQAKDLLGDGFSGLIHPLHKTSGDACVPRRTDGNPTRCSRRRSISSATATSAGTSKACWRAWAKPGPRAAC